ncbi:MAG: tRNA uridine-5-carboxymethylaminomethyl(34) synthesis enzyme MnmG, partial [Planctomycetes bacterium]|nr:tRNA uridine-5-carboxymethylaminomethyl(34) synthesis enzyme MnmG [Planctomycetota bacterium]
MEHRYDVIVIGGGHAGTEAAWAASRLGATVALVTMERVGIGRMSCNPAIGGIGKGQMVREIDALGGIMGLAIDRAGIHFRMLNQSKGPAVWAPRAQADRTLYAKAIQDILAEAADLNIVEGMVEAIETTGAPAAENGSGARVCGVLLADGRRLHADSVIVTTGTFMRGLMHCGQKQEAGGRFGEASAGGISQNLMSLGFELGRLKTGTPPRVDRDSLDYDQLERQDGDETPIPFSFVTDRIDQPSVPCWITYTNQATHDHIHANLHRAPMYMGQIESTGPRYCPSIEDKVVRFADKSRHQLFLEPEGYDSDRVYCNGISTSLPEDVQRAMLATIPGMQRARIVQLGYAVEYDFIPTWQTRESLESKRVVGLFFAGQINGTSGYEEAAGQGLVAGVNSVR